MNTKNTFAIALTLSIVTSSIGGVFAQRRPQPRRTATAPAKPPTTSATSSERTSTADTPAAPAADSAKGTKGQDFVLNLKEMPAGTVRGVTVTSTDDSVLVDDAEPDIKVEAANATQLAIESQQLRKDKKALLLMVRAPEEAFGTATLRVMRGNEKNGQLTDAAFLDLKITEFQARPIPRKPTPSGIRRVDLMWSVLPDEVIKDNFGRKTAKHYYGIQVVIGNNTGFDLQVVSLGFKTDLKPLQDSAIAKAAHADSGTAKNPTATAGNKSPETKFHIPVLDHRFVRGTIEKEQAFGSRNLALSLITGFGTLSTGFLPFFHALGPRANFSTFTSMLNGNFKEGFGLAIPDLTIRQLNRLENQVMHDQLIIPNNTQERTVVFVPKGILDLNRTANLEGAKNFKPSIEQIMTFMGELTLVGRKIEYVEMEDREVVVARTDAQNVADAARAVTNNPPPAKSPISVDSVTPNFGTVSEAKEVTITGSGFTPGEEVKVRFGGDPFVLGKAISATQVKATVPPRVAAGEIYVEVIAGERKDKLEKGYTYFDELRIDGFDPPSVPVAGGATVKIKGKGFMSGAKVKIDNAPIENVSVSNDSKEITITVPAHAAGPVTVEVTNPSTKTFSFKNALTYVAPPAGLPPSQ